MFSCSGTGVDKRSDGQTRDCLGRLYLCFRCVEKVDHSAIVQCDMESWMGVPVECVESEMRNIVFTPSRMPMGVQFGGFSLDV